ncbi:MAG: hypothetical protein Q9195_002302 [Heterodermia aff. obscurata]
MDQTISTSRLKLILITKAERGSSEFAWLHEIYSNEQATWWSINGRSKSIEDTERMAQGSLPASEEGKEETKSYRILYAVHTAHDETTSDVVNSQAQSLESETISTELIGLVSLKSTNSSSLALPEHLTIPADAAATTLTVDLAYMFLPAAWGKGYATETLEAVFEGCRRARSFWTPYSKVYVRAIVNEENPASMRVMHKTEMIEKGVYVWTGQPVFLAGKWVERSSLHIYGMHLLE